ncbi:MAG: DUF1176 domain-containing protein [Candidatus Accumulibacter sp.]|jgi:hypothetical protein|nr:DUF1176 domain-containing protein [Accumulibacter sp.]
MKHLWWLAVVLCLLPNARAEAAAAEKAGPLANKKPPVVCPEGLSYSHHDWRLVCDNTCTCRAAGYQSDDDALFVSLLLTRKAGPDEPVTADFLIGGDGEERPADKLPSTFGVSLRLRINDRDVGKLVIEDNMFAELGTREISTLLRALLRNSKIELVAGDIGWRLSDKGAAAVLLKMDEYQGRLGTPGALVRKGKRSERSVFAPRLAPVVIAVPFHKPLPGDERFVTENSVALQEALRATLNDDDGYCPKLVEDDWPRFRAIRLTETKMLVSTDCWRRTYNNGTGYWVFNTLAPYDPTLITTSASHLIGSTISADRKGRDTGDCWNSDEWTWDGARFIHTKSSSSAMCKPNVPPDGWVLPTIVTEVRTAR